MMTTNLPRSFTLIASLSVAISTWAAEPKFSVQMGIEAQRPALGELDASAARIARGTIRDARGNPIAGAVIEVTGVATGNGTRRHGAVTETDPFAVSNEAGEFAFYSTVPVEALLVHVSWQGIANQTATLVMGQTQHLLATEGTSVTGRVMKDGQPVSGIVVGISPQDRRAGGYVGHFETETDADGRFFLPNIPSKTDYLFYGAITAEPGHDVIPVRRLYVGADGGTTDVGEIAITSKGHRVRGRIQLADGGELPEGVRIRLGRESVPDSVVVEAGPTGTFEFIGVPAEVVHLSMRVPGYAISSKNGSFDVSNRRLLGRIDGDKEDLVVLLEPSYPSGRLFTFTPTNAAAPRKDRPRDRVLRGIEPQSP